MPKDGGSITQCDDIGDVADDEHGLDDTKIEAAEVAAVIKLDTYAACIACKSKVEQNSDKLGHCTKCSTMQCLSKCSTMQCLSKCTQQISAKLVIATNTATEFLTLLRGLRHGNLIFT